MQVNSLNDQTPVISNTPESNETKGSDKKVNLVACRLLSEIMDHHHKNCNMEQPELMFQMVKLLIESGADINHPGEYKYTPLHSAVAYGNRALVSFLLDHGADVSCKDELGTTPITSAIDSRKLDIMRLLVEKDADVNVSDCFGITPLAEAVVNKDLELVELLISKKADVNLKTRTKSYSRERVFVLYEAVRYGALDIAVLLIRNGANFTCIDKSEGKERYQIGEKTLSENANIFMRQVIHNLRRDSLVKSARK